MEQCGFFDANLVGETYDRVYLAANFAAYFASFIGNGVFGGKSQELQVVANSTPNMSVVVSAGQGWINGYWYENTETLILPIAVADGVLTRIDSVVLRLDFAQREMYCAVKTGSPAVKPVAPTVTRNADYYELQLATVRVNNGAINIQNANITDTRLNTALCGLVMCTVQTFDTTAFGLQLETFITDYIEQANQEHETWLSSINNLYNLAYAAYQAYLDYLNNNSTGLKAQSLLAYQNFLAWLQSFEDDSVSSVQDILAQLEGLIDEQMAAQLDARITALERLEPTVLVGDIEHNLGIYPDWNLYETTYVVGVQQCGYGPCGGGSFKSIPLEVEMADKNNVRVKTKQGYGTVDSVVKLGEGFYSILFTDGVTSLVLMANSLRTA